MKKTIIKPLILATAVISSPMIATSAAQAASVSGNIGVFSQYILRGITNVPENDDATVQGGFDVGFDNGLYLGYWGSSLGYGDDQNGFENDFYGGYGGSIGDFSYDIGVIQYYYINIDDFDGTEAYGSVGYGPFSLGAKTLLNDVAWGNQGDTYWTANFSQPLPKGFNFDATLGYYTYEDSGEYIASTPEDGAFRHLNLSLSHPIGNTGADMGVTYVIGGKDRNGVDQDNAVFFSLTYGFDIM
ncbi:MAG: hypothetical protein JXJ30_09395 [Halothiobacillaceae bacterium]|nr:hypothetical protein [Halothiobacillaceae bacterium]HER34717.1 hypothetical protein [Halothiobacillaceae bacterium]